MVLTENKPYIDKFNFCWYFSQVVSSVTQHFLTIGVLVFILGTAGAVRAQNAAAVDSVQTTQVSVTSGYFEKSPEHPEAVIYSRDQNGPVQIEHDGVHMWCDQALVYFKENFVKAFGSVKITQGDTIKMYSDYGEYNGDTSFAFAAGNVILEEPQTNLASDTLYFDRQKQEAYYLSGGTVRDTSSVLTSRIGRYFTNTKKYQFESAVTITNPSYTVNAPRVDFFTESGLAYLYGASKIDSETSTIYCDRGYYNTRTNIGHFVKNSRVDYKSRVLYGDSIYFDRSKGFASATNHIKLIDSLNKTVVHGHYAEVFKAQDSVYITNRAVAVSLQEQDSVYIHADTLRITGKPDQRVIKGFYEARFFKPGVTISERTSGLCDSIVVTQKIGLTEMLGRPILWSGENQITGDTIHLIQNLVREEMDSLKVFDNAFMIQKDLEGFNQVKGGILIGNFTENKLDTVDIIKNSQVIFYSRDENEDLVGINHTVSSAIQLYLDEQRIKGIRFINKVPGKVYPSSEFPENARILPGFLWRGNERLFYKEDLFAGKTFPDLIPIRGIPMPQVIDLETKAVIDTKGKTDSSDQKPKPNE